MQKMLSDSGRRQYVIETALALLLVCLLITASSWVLMPFVGALTYAVILATATARLFDRMIKLVNGRRRLAALLFGLIVATIMILPLIYLSIAVADYVGLVEARLAAATSHGIPDLPAWIGGLPLLGEKATQLWQELQSDGLVFPQKYQPQLTAAGVWLLNLSTSLMVAVLEMLLGIIMAAMIYASRIEALHYVSAITERIVGPNAGEVLGAAGRAIRGVAVGVIGTALLESVLAWVGFAIAGVPGAVLLAGLTFFFAVIQIGPLVVWLPVAIWLGFQGQTGWAIFVAIWGIVLLMGADNIVKPVLISRSGQLPTLVLFVGVIGGLAAWGFTGMFIGATTLAILWTVVQAWLARPPIGWDSLKQRD